MSWLLSSHYLRLAKFKSVIFPIYDFCIFVYIERLKLYNKNKK